MARYDENGFITELDQNEIFVFGSNGEGAHFGGAAAAAVQKFGAKMGQAEGLQGQSYAINTMDSESEMFEQIDRFLKFTKEHPKLIFLVTEIGCGIAGYDPRQVAPYFRSCTKNVILPEIFLKVLNEGRMLMNIYLDIDGVILSTASPKEDIVGLITYILDNYPDSTYWLTTHCKHGENRCAEWLRGKLPNELVDRMETVIKPTDWEALKTEAIDMDQDFVWFDDNLFETEKRVLEAYYVLDGFYKMNPEDPEMAKKALAYLQNISDRA